MPAFACAAIAKSFGSVPVLAGIDLEIADGEFLTLVGSSGCGKSTLIRIIAGLEPQTSGSVEIDGRAIDHLRPHERRVALVFQSYALYPHMSAGANIALPLTMQRLSQWERMPLVKHLSPRRRARDARRSTRKCARSPRSCRSSRCSHRRPSQLSGGQRQRVALGRSMVRHPDVFLMDEPLSNLDAKLRVHMRTELAELHKRLQATFVYVTHDQVEAMTMSDRVAMMDAGRILQLGTPSELYAAPANLKVAQFIGSPAINLLPATVVDGGALDVLGHRLRLRTTLAPGTAATIGIRPEAIAPRGSGAGGPPSRSRSPRCAAASRTSAPSTSCTSTSRASTARSSPAGSPPTATSDPTPRRSSSSTSPPVTSSMPTASAPSRSTCRAAIATHARGSTSTQRATPDARARPARPAAAPAPRSAGARRCSRSSPASASRCRRRSCWC